ARRPEDTDWERIAALYDGLAEISPSPVVELNRAAAAGMAEGPERTLEMIDAAGLDHSLDGYALLPAARGDALERLGRGAEARAEFERAAALSGNERQRDLLLRRAARC
ncbi:MAG: RNA polymerase subunit sigma-24, partial [Solirubrobacterales bacterium]|nr:RNA polymerase subunit sigma-24 [Solirubrobacterales bacterium]